MISNVNLGARKISKEAFSLTPSSLISLFVIDISQSIFDNTASSVSSQKVFRFHNSVKLTSNDIIFNSEKYIAAPIQAEGFEINSRGTIPTPRLAITTNDEGVSALAAFKASLKTYGDLVGAKVTRIRTFAKFLDATNFSGQTPPTGFDPDPYAEFPRDIFFIERKSKEDKFSLEFELSSPLDFQGTLLPGRIVISDRCTWDYRGEGCLYEYDGNTPDKMRRNVDIHGADSEMPSSAPPVANENDEDIVGGVIPDITGIVDKGEYSPSLTYSKGDAVYIVKNGIKYYFVAKFAIPINATPPNGLWVADSCSKCVVGCEKRWGAFLRFGGFPAVNRLPQ